MSDEVLSLFDIMLKLRASGSMSLALGNNNAVHLSYKM